MRDNKHPQWLADDSFDDKIFAGKKNKDPDILDDIFDSDSYHYLV